MAHPTYSNAGILASAATLLCIVVVAVVPRQGRALEPDRPLHAYHVDRWTREDGLPQQAATALYQSRDGHLWIGTQVGIVRFDGLTMEVLDTGLDRDHVPQVVHAISEDEDGTIWVATGRGGMLQITADGVQAFTMAHGLPSNQVTAVVASAHGLIVGTHRGLACLGGDRFEPCAAPDGVTSALMQARDGALWAGTSDGQVASWSRGEPATTLAALQEAGAITALLETADGAVLVGSERLGVLRYDSGSLTPWRPTSHLNSFGVTGLLEGDRGEIWIGTSEHGVCRANAGDLECSGHLLGDDGVESLALDHEGSLWIGVPGRGLSRLRDTTFSALGTQHGLADLAVRAIHEGPTGVWIGTEEGLYRVTDAGVIALPPPPGRDTITVMGVFEERAGRTWVATFRDGVWLLDQDRWTPLPRSDGEPFDHAIAVTRTSDGAMWFGGRAGLMRYQDGRTVRFGPPRLPWLERVDSLYEDRHGVLWIGTLRSGVARYHDGVLERFEPYGVGEAEPAPVLAFLESGHDSLWAATTAGLARITETDVQVYTAEHGLLDSTIYTVLGDGSGYLWMSSNRGIFRVAEAELDAFDAGALRRVTSLSFGTRDGMPSPECNGGYQQAGHRAHDGRLWFPTVAGVAIADPARIQTNDIPPPVVIHQVLVDGQPVRIEDSLNLAPEARRLQIDYAALTFINPGAVRHRYRLHGFDEDWVEAGAERQALYTNLPPGSFRFQVTACNADGVWNDVGASLVLERQPAFHQTRLFHLACASVLLALAGVGYRWRIGRMRRRQEELERMVEARSRQLVEAENLLAEARHLPVRFGPYILVSVLGDGGMARVYRAIREGPMGFRKELAIKRIRTDLTRGDEALVRSMVNEARLGGQLKHPNVVDTYEFGSVGDQYYIAMEYVDGWTLDTLLAGAGLRGVRLPHGAVIDLAIQVTAGLAYAHQLRGPSGQRLRLVHRDLKPANIILSREGQAKIMDFGIARSEDAAFQTTLTSQIKGTPRFMSPEQLQDARNVDHRSDIFAMGSILFELLTGEPLMTAPSLQALFFQIVSGSYGDRIREIDPILPAARPLLDRCLALDREDRYQDANELGTALDDLQGRIGDVHGSVVLARLLISAAHGHAHEVEELTARLSTRASLSDDWQSFAASLTRAPGDRPDPYRRPGPSALGVGDVDTAEDAAGATTRDSIPDPAADDDVATVIWRGDDP